MKYLVGATSPFDRERPINMFETSFYQGVSNPQELWYARTNPVQAYYFDNQSA